MAGIPLDPASGAAFALAGRVVTMGHAGVISAGVVYGRNGSIVSVTHAGSAAPPGFSDVPVVDTGGTIFPGLIELHNHLPYDVLQLWQVPKPYGDRGQWSDSHQNPDYHRLITGPMQAIGSDPALVAAIVRYVEVRALLGGTTTSQGVTLAKSKVTVTHFRGLVRNVEHTEDPDLPAAATHIADIDARDATKFKQRISGQQKVILHLAEGDDDAASRAFEALHLADGSWAITNNLIGIHCVALADADFEAFAANGGSMVWSPLSNLLLYGKTANIGAALRHRMLVALGSDWAPSGNKNLLGELKVARLARGAAHAPGLTDKDLVRMTTATPAKMLGWGAALGSIEKTKRADLIVVAGTAGDPYTSLVDATEAELILVMINGVARAATPRLMRAFGITTGLEQITVGGQHRVLNLTQAGADPLLESVTLAEAVSRLTIALSALPRTSTTRAAVAARANLKRGTVRLAVEGLVDNRQTPRPHLPLRGKPTGPNPPRTRTLAAAHAAIAGRGPLPELTLDPLTAVDNPGFYDALSTETNLTEDVCTGLALYRRPKSARRRRRTAPIISPSVTTAHR